MYKITIFKGLPFKQECINPVTGNKFYKTMEYPPFHEDITMVFDIIGQEKLKSQIDLMRTLHDTDKSKYDELKPDLVIMDITMPNMDGLEALKTIRAKDPNAVVVMCSAMGQEAMVIDALKSGAKDFIVKPFKPDRLMKTVTTLLG